MAQAAGSQQDAEFALQANVGQLQVEGLSYEEYFKNVHRLIELLLTHWHSDQRVQSLKVAIQLAKLLADTTQLRLYANKFALISNVLRDFGRLIRARVHQLADQQQEQQPDSLLALERAKETCRNWYLKVASIRELVPRFYIEISIMQAHDILLAHSEPNLELQFIAEFAKRLDRVAWGIGDPVVQLKARLFLCRATCEHLLEDDKRQKQRQQQHHQHIWQLISQLVRTNLSHSTRMLVKFDHLRYVAKLNQTQGVEMFNLYFELCVNSLRSMFSLITSNSQLDDELSLTADQLDSKEESRLSVVEMLAAETQLILDDQFLPAASTHHQTAANSIVCGCILLSAAIKSVPCELVSSRAAKMLDIIHGHIFRGHYSQALEREICSAAIYQTLEAFLAALNSSDAFELTTRVADKSLQLIIYEQSNEILECLLLDHWTNNDTTRKQPEQRQQQQQQQHNGANNTTRAFNQHYLSCFKSLVGFSINYLLLADHHEQNYQSQLVNMMENFIARMKVGRQYAQHQTLVVSLVKCFFQQFNFDSIKDELTFVDRLTRTVARSSGVMLQLAALLHKDENKLELSRWILEHLRANMKLIRPASHNANGPLSCPLRDRQIIGFLVRVFALLNDSINVLTTLPEDCDHLTRLIVFFLRRIQIDDLREKLEFLTECRHCLSNLNSLLAHLAEEALELPDKLVEQKLEASPEARGHQLAARADKFKRTKHFKNFLNGCLAFAFITIPASNDPDRRLHLFIKGAQLAYDKMSLSLADYFMRQLVATLSDQIDLHLMRDRIESSRRQLEAMGNEQSHTVSLFGRDATDPKMTMIDLASLVQFLASTLTLTIKRQDHTDLRHKLKLADLIATRLASLQTIQSGADETLANSHQNLVCRLAQLNCALDLANSTDENLDVANSDP